MKKAIRQFLDREEAAEQIRLYSFPSDSMLSVIIKKASTGCLLLTFKADS